MASPVDVGSLPNHVKYCVSVLSLQWANFKTSPVGIPYNWYQSWWFKVVFDFCSKIKVVKIVFWPYHCVEEEETKPLVKTTSKSDIGHDRTCHHTPVSRLPTRADAPHASSSPGWANPTRIPDDISVYSWHAKSAPSHLTRQHSGTHMPRHQPRAELSGAELSVSRAASRGIGSSVGDPMCNRIWDWIWAVNQARIVLIKS